MLDGLVILLSTSIASITNPAATPACTMIVFFEPAYN